MQLNARTAMVAIVGIVALAGVASASELAKVNGRAITEKDLQAALSGLTEGQRDQLLRDDAMRRQVLSNVIDQEVMFQAAEKDKLETTPEYKEALENFRKQFLTNLYIQKRLGTKLNDKEAKAFYDRNKKKFSTDQVRAQHILVSTEAEAKDLLKQAKAEGADFQALAEKSSKDPSAKNNRGDLGFFTRDRMVPEFSDAAFAAKAGEVIGPIKTAYGFHVIKVVEKKDGRPMNYDEVELQVKGALRQDLIRGLVNDLKKTAKVEVSASK